MTPPPLFLADGRVNYRCTFCGVSGVKLWRHYQSCLSELFCVDCACQRESCLANFRDASKVGPDGFHNASGNRTYKYRTCELNGLVPCITDEEGTEVWGYCASIPRPRRVWWFIILPLRDRYRLRAQRRARRRRHRQDCRTSTRAWDGLWPDLSDVMHRAMMHYREGYHYEEAEDRAIIWKMDSWDTPKDALKNGDTNSPGILDSCQK